MNPGKEASAKSPSQCKLKQAADPFEIGSEHAVSYFTNENGRCNLVVTRAGEPNWDQGGSLTVSRFESSILTGKSARYDGSVEFTCAADAQSMLIKQDTQVAASNAK